MLNFYPARPVARPVRPYNMRGTSAATLLAANGATPPQARRVLAAMLAAHYAGALPLAASW